MRNTLRNRKANQGFTLTELLIVVAIIAIIAILAAVLIPNLLQARSRVQDTAAQSCAQNTATTSEVTMIDGQEYTTVDEATIPTCNNVTVGGGAASDGTTYTYTATYANGSATSTVMPGSGVVRGAAAAE